MIHRIVLTGDVFRSHAGEREQLPNVEWLRRRFAPILKGITGIDPEIRMAGPPPFGSVEPVCNLYRIFGENPGINSWARTFFADPPSELLEVLEADYADSLVVSIELSPLLERVLDKLNVPWIDVGISPLRFMPDFAISFRMSHHFENRFPSHLSLTAKTIDDSVARVKEFYSASKNDKIEGSIVFFAQTPSDRTLIKDGAFAGVKEAIEAISNIRGKRRVLIKPHPWAPDNPVVTACVCEFGAEVIDTNTYAILSSSCDTHIVTLSSSVGREAQAFGRLTCIGHDVVQKIAYSGPASMYHGRG